MPYSPSTAEVKVSVVGPLPPKEVLRRLALPLVAMALGVGVVLTSRSA